MQSIIDAYRRAERRLLLLDYDGTLVELAASPAQAIPGAQLLEVLEELAADKQNEVVIVSGRDQATLDAWLGNLNIGLAAEHGFFVKPYGSDWHSATSPSQSWWPSIMALMQAAAEQLPGSFIEEKQSTLAWHYRLADKTAATLVVHKLRVSLDYATAGLDLTVLMGHKVIEVKSSRINKGDAAAYWLASDSFDFILAAGDDVTDEHLFAALPKQAFSLAVGESPTPANHMLSSPTSVLGLLESFTRSSTAKTTIG